MFLNVIENKKTKLHDLGKDYSPDEFHFRSTDKQRAQQSGRCYATG
jgi:hypothetical protein